MQCFICVTYMVVAWSATGRARFLLNDVALSQDAMQAGDLVIALHRDRDVTDIQTRELEDELSIPTDAQYLPKLNHRLEALRYHHRTPKALAEIKLEYPNIDESYLAKSKNDFKNTEDSHGIPRSTVKPKENCPKANNPKFENIAQKILSEDLIANTMAGASHIGNAKAQTLIKPTIIVNVRGPQGAIDARFQNKKFEKEYEFNSGAAKTNEFNINQRISFDSPYDRNEPMKNPLKQTVIYDFKNTD